MSSAPSSQDIRADYMLLLVTQLRNQNPLEPMDNNQMASQLAQLSQLEQTENMSRTFQQVLQVEQRAQATGLIGQKITFFPKDSDTLYQGTVQSVDLSDGKVALKVGSFAVGLGDIQEVLP